jgi:hypothetical protein
MDRAARFPIRRSSSLDAMRAEEYAYSQQRAAHERMAAVTTLSKEDFGLKGELPDGSGLRRSFFRVNLRR